MSSSVPSRYFSCIVAGGGGEGGGSNPWFTVIFVVMFVVRDVWLAVIVAGSVVEL